MLGSTRLLIVSNRLPVTIERTESGHRIEPSSGGLITALLPIVRQEKGCWLGWTGGEYDPQVDTLLSSDEIQADCRMIPVFLTEEERARFYCGFCNEIIWPLFHDLQSRCNFDPSYWQAYVAVNQKFANAIASLSTAETVVWVHDYHLILQAELLRKCGIACRTGYFHHIPFPPPDIFEKLPWRIEILSSLMSFNLIGFQTARDQHNFLSCVQRFLPNTTISDMGEHVIISALNGCVTVGSFPIGIDFDEFASEAVNQDVVARAGELKRALANCQIVLGVDRLDYTKGIPERLKAFRLLLESHPELHRRIALIQVVVPSRGGIPKYDELKLEVERLVSEVNGQYGSPEWMPIHYIHRHLPRVELVACYRAADIALVTPLKDGMNLVAKEFCAAQTDNRGVLVLSEFAGAATQLGCGALLVNPYDARAVAEAVRYAFKMPPRERQIRMMRLRHNVRHSNARNWFSSYWEMLQRANVRRSSTQPDRLLHATRAGGAL